MDSYPSTRVLLSALITASRMRDGIPIYRVADWNGAPIQGTFYPQELQKVDVSDGKSFKIERIIKH